MPDYESAQFRQSLAEAIAWCSARSLGIEHVDHTAVAHRKALQQQADRLWEEARTQAKQSWLHPEPYKTEQGRQAISLFEQVTASFGPLEHVLRSESLKPSVLPESSSKDAAWRNAVSEVAAKRSELIHQLALPQIENESNGRLLLYIPSENLADGAAQQSSNGFYDADNVPPWDLWVDFSDGTLVSWIPPVLIDAAQTGIDANPEECIRWAG